MTETSTAKTTSTKRRGTRKRVVASVAAAAVLASGFVTTSTATVAEAAPYTCSTPRLGGKLWFDEDGDKVKDAEETPVEGVTMRVYKHTLAPDHSATMVGEFTTGADGSYKTPALSAGYHSVEIAGELPSGFDAERTTQSTNVVAKKCDDGINFPLGFTSSKSAVKDLTAGMSNFTEIQWATNQELFALVNERFMGEQKMLRGEGAEAMYRAGGTEAEPPSFTPFTDVASDSEYFEAISWLVDQGVVNGHAEYSFGVDRELLRGEVALILFRMTRPDFKTPTTPSFTDIPKGDLYYSAVEWMKSTGITLGYTDKTFRRLNTITRRELAIFLYRYDQKYGD
ncbi:S-layer homology domain-containing protein (plasmid) [Citricoccus nitrophenolicus]